MEKKDEMKRYVCWIMVLGGLCLILAGCLNRISLFNKVEPFTGPGSGKWRVTLNSTIQYTFDFDRQYIESAYTCEIGCSGKIDAWKVEKGVLTGTTRCDMIYVTFEGEGGKDACEGIYKVYTLTGEFLRQGSFTGTPM
jgi:hypothetical protein